MAGRLGFAAAMLTALVALLALNVPAVLAQPSEREAEAKVDALGRNIQALAERLDDTAQARSDASRQLEKVETQLAATHQRLDELHIERRRLDDEIVTLEARRDDLRQERDIQRQALSEQLNALYRLGASPQLKLLLNQDNPARLDRLQSYLNYLARARNERLDALAQLDERLRDNLSELQNRRERLANLADEVEAQSLALAERRRRREALVAELDARHASEKSRLSDLNQERAAAERVLDQVREELKRLAQPPPSTAIAQTRGTLPWPVQGKILSAFGNGEGVNRNGLVIGAAEGSAISAIHPGRVVFADWMRGFGNLLILDHGDDIMSLYAHVQRFHVTLGERIERNDIIAAVGSTGGRSNPALYFEVRRAGEPIDPQKWIAER